MRRDYDFVTWAEPNGGHRRSERIASTRGECEVLDAKMLGVARFESFAFIADAVSEKRVGADHARDRVDLFLSGLVQDVPFALKRNASTPILAPGWVQQKNHFVVIQWNRFIGTPLLIVMGKHCQANVPC
jgi:hypothetical protein